MNNPMDVYSSRMDIPFSTAAYCRGHKFCVEAVRLRQVIEKAAQAKKLVEQAEQVLSLKEAELKDALDAVARKMERDPL